MKMSNNLEILSFNSNSFPSGPSETQGGIRHVDAEFFPSVEHLLHGVNHLERVPQLCRDQSLGEL